MNERIRTHIEELFENAPNIKKITELKEELLSNSNSKYDDLLASGASPDDAYKTVISGMGDVSGLIEQLRSERQADSAMIEEGRKKSALLVSIGVGILIMAVAAEIFFEDILHLEGVGLFVMLIMAAFGVGILVYNSMTKVQYNKKEDTFVEEFKQRKVETSQSKGMRAAVSGILWPLIFITYFLVSFITTAWHISWVIFIAGACIEGVISLLFEMKKGE
jgi:hypothetical protein